MGVNHLGRLAAKQSSNTSGMPPSGGLKSSETGYEDADIYKVLSTFEERITLIKEAISLDITDRDASMAALSSTVGASTITSATPMAAGGSMQAMLSLMDEGKRKTAIGPGGAVIDATLVGIDTNM